MKKTVLTFGLISGAMSASMMLITVPFIDAIGWKKGEILGYTGIVLSAPLVFFGVRSYRENAGGGRLTFGRGFAVGILITLISSASISNSCPALRKNMPPTWWSVRRRPERARRRWMRRSGKQSSSRRCTTIQRSMWP